MAQQGLYAFDQSFLGQGFQDVCGVDEAGRGPLAGPVFAAAVILPQGLVLPGLNDSKKLTGKRREALFEEITQKASCYCIASATEAEIDTYNILGATMLAMQRAVEGLAMRPDCLLVDGNRAPELPGIQVETVIKGDATSACIAAASILAKVARDRCLVLLDEQYPAYRFAQHKGYPTKLHYELLDEYGPSPVHRKSFLRKWEQKRK